MLVDPGEGEEQHLLLVLAGGRLTSAIFVVPPGTGALAGELIGRSDLMQLIAGLRNSYWNAS